MTSAMSSDDQHFLDALSSIPYQTADVINRQLDYASSKLRDSLESTSWLPDFARPRRPPPPPPSAIGRALVPHGFLRSTYDWVWDHRRILFPTLAFVGTAGVLSYRRKKAYSKKRRARRAQNGAKTEVVVVIGIPNAPLTRSVVLDLERRGFIVYVVASTSSEEQLIKDHGKSEILPLHLNVTSPLDVESTISHFTRTLNTPQHAHPGSEKHMLEFSGVVVIPDITYPSGPVETISPELWADALNAKVLGTIASVQAFIRPMVSFGSRLVIATPTIVPSLRPPFQSLQSCIVGALDGFTDSLQSEMATVGVDVYQLRLGTFDLSPMTGGSQPLSRQLGNEVLGWPAFAREAYKENFLRETKKHQEWWTALESGARGHGSSLRELNNAVFDCLTGHKPTGAHRIGQGSALYGVVGAIAPAALVRWMMGITTGSAASKGRRLSETWERVDSVEK